MEKSNQSKEDCNLVTFYNLNQEQLNDITRFYEYFNHDNPTEVIVFDKIKYPKGFVSWVKNKNDFINLINKFNKEKIDLFIGGRDRVDKGDDNVVSSDFIFFEIDEHDIKKPLEKEKVERFLNENGIEAGMVGFSGGGFHFYIPHKKFIFNSQEDRNFYKKVLTAFKDALIDYGIDIDTKVFDLQRVSRVLGSFNFKRNEQSKILIYNKNVNLAENQKAIRNLIVKYEKKDNVVVDKTAIELLEKYNIDKTDRWFYDLLKRRIEIKKDTGGNSIVLKNIATILTRENIPKEEIEVIGRAVIDLCEDRTLSAFYGWIKRCEDNQQYEIYKNQLNKFIEDNHYDLTPYDLTLKEKIDNKKYYEKTSDENVASFEEPLTIQELMGNLKKKRNPIIKNFVEENAIHTFYGNTGSLKSFLLIYMSVCIASGKPFLNHYKTRKCPVLYLSGENHVDLEAERVNAIAKGLKINIKRRAYKNIQFKHFSRKQIKLLNNNFYYEHLRETIEKNKIKVLVLDTLSVMTLDVNDNASQEIMKIFSEKLFPLVDEFGLSIIIIAHSQKTGKDYLGSVKNKGSVDLFFKVVREGNIIKLNCEKGRRGEHNCEIKVDLITHKDTDKPIKSITFNFLSESEGIIKEKEKQDISNKIEQAKELILGELEGGDELSFTDLLKICANNGISANPFKKAMNQLYDSKEIRKKAGKRGGYYVE